ncbi:Epithelial splicing regulatory protein 1 [Neolecta irregularis DAH-3]|uniref:Epithelial splicing regulatory protein 1 n=1 Tax=Neolecta irregularis (strain DAH-3) TaxID=1198029 RepID=A0A1U7LKW2_NEOID|nr:Epithelial splicing regulatory protein 1 [Neolecta irregularis DAH-3]|eukprot:OLL23233.1 Epithelial splicing regulatory protein 1 [Neolecta irregularis DAH-3]
MLSPTLSVSYGHPRQQDFVIYDQSNGPSRILTSQQQRAINALAPELKLKPYQEDLENCSPGYTQLGRRHNQQNTGIIFGQSVNALNNAHDEILYTNPAKYTAVSTIRPPSESYDALQEGYLPRTSTPRLSVPPGFESSLMGGSPSNQCHQCAAGLSVMLLTPCGHRICQSCMRVLITRNLSSICSCTLCGEHISCFVSTGMQDLKAIPSPQAYTSDLTPPNNAYIPAINSVAISGKDKLPEYRQSANFQIDASSFIEHAEDLSHHNSFQELSQLAKPHDYIVVKISNIPWDSTIANVQEFLGKNCRLPPAAEHAQSIHITMDRMSGKTSSDCYVEFTSLSDAQRIVQRKHNRLLGSRNVSLSISTKEELMKIIFPKWRGDWRGVDPYVTPEIMAERHFAIPDAPFVTREELNSILVHAKIYRSPYSKKCPERPYESLVSIIFPWHQAEFYTAMQRDHLFEALKIGVESLRNHISKGNLPKLDRPLLERLVYSGLQNVVFTERQKLGLLQVARMRCPEDMLHLIAPPLMQNSSENPSDRENFQDSGLHLRALTATPQTRFALQPIISAPPGQIGTSPTPLNTSQQHLSELQLPAKAHQYIQPTCRPTQPLLERYVHQVSQEFVEPQRISMREAPKIQRQEIVLQQANTIHCLHNQELTARLLNPSTAKHYFPLLDLSKVNLDHLKVRAEELGIQCRTAVEIPVIKAKQSPNKAFMSAECSNLARKSRSFVELSKIV